MVGGGAGTPFCSLPAGLHGALYDVKSVVGTGSMGVKAVPICTPT